MNAAMTRVTSSQERWVGWMPEAPIRWCEYEPEARTEKNYRFQTIIESKPAVNSSPVNFSLLRSGTQKRRLSFTPSHSALRLKLLHVRPHLAVGVLVERRATGGELAERMILRTHQRRAVAERAAHALA